MSGVWPMSFVIPGGTVRCTSTKSRNRRAPAADSSG
jgi:hypothetical protein